MSNAITNGELSDLHVPGSDRILKMEPVGCVEPNGSRTACKALVRDVGPCALYCEIVHGNAMKFGTAGSVINRERLNEGTINNIMAFQDGRYLGRNRKITDPTTYDKYKRLAPQVIRSGETIEIWAVSLSSAAQCQHPLKKYDARCAGCKGVEGSLNDHFETIQFGWASRRN
ncbi:MAG: hypothetical protein WCP28_19395 [Actinomycetes bacterium]